MFFQSSKEFLRALNLKKKRNLLALSVLSTSAVLGYITFLASCLSGFLLAKYLGSKDTGKRSKIPSLAFPLGKYKIHLHHWLISTAVMAAALVKGTWFLPSELLYGFLSGIAFQGVCYYDDWHKILILRQGKAPASTETWKSPGESEFQGKQPPSDVTTHSCPTSLL